MTMTEQDLIKAVKNQFSNLDDLREQANVNFLNELEDFVDSKKLNIDSILSSMKLFILNRYRLQIEEQGLSELN